jgi:hypothetical protein
MFGIEIKKVVDEILKTSRCPSPHRRWSVAKQGEGGGLRLIFIFIILYSYLFAEGAYFFSQIKFNYYFLGFG